MIENNEIEIACLTRAAADPGRAVGGGMAAGFDPVAAAVALLGAADVAIDDSEARRVVGLVC